MDPLQRIVCDWCSGQSAPDAKSCVSCGAQLDIKNLVSDSGWREAPRLKDMSEVRFGSSVCQVEGDIVPVADVTLGANDSVFFEHHVMLWKDPAVPLGSISLGFGVARMLGGMPYMISTAKGPGRIAFSRDANGEVIIMPLHKEMELDVRGHAFLLCSHSVQYSFVRVKGLRNVLFGGAGMYMDRFITKGESGILVLHGYGNVFERRLAAGESVMLEHGAFLYKDASVTMEVERQRISTGIFGGVGLYMAKMTGPGRLGIQSMYHHHHTG